MKDEDIDYSDIPELDASFFATARVVVPPGKQQLTVRLDKDVLAWLKTQGKGYHTRINAIPSSPGRLNGGSRRRAGSGSAGGRLRNPGNMSEHPARRWASRRHLWPADRAWPEAVRWTPNAEGGSLVAAFAPVVRHTPQPRPACRLLHWRSLFLSLALVLSPIVMTGACGQSNAGGGRVFRWEDIPPGAVVIATNTVVDAATEDGRALEAARARLLGIREEWSYGTPDGPDNTLWGWIRDVATDADDNVYAVDGLLNIVRVLSPAGELLAETFRAGDGPMEIRGPAGLEFVGDTLVVYSPFGFVYAAGEPQNLTETERFPEIPGIEDACVGDTLLFARIMPFPEPASVRAMNLDGTEVGVFGEVLEHDVVSVQINLSRGQIACTHEPERVVTSFNDGPLIHAYDYSGAPEWVAHLDGFRAPEVRSVPLRDGRFAVSRPGESPEDRVQKLTSLPGGLVLVQVNRLGLYEVVDDRRIRKVRRRDSYILSARTGAGVYVGPGLPEVLHATERRLFVMDTHDELDYVILRAYRW